MNRERIRDTFEKLLAKGTQGFTVDHDGNEYRQKRGFAVASSTHATLDEALGHVGETQFIGYWHDRKNGRAYIEVVDIVDSGLVAIMLGVRRGEHAVYDFVRDNLIPLGGFYNEQTTEARTHATGDETSESPHGKV